MPVIAVLGSTAGRWVRGIIGVALGAVGVIAGQWWLLLLAPGLLFLASAVFDFCLLGPLAKLPMRGPAFRAACARPRNA